MSERRTRRLGLAYAATVLLVVATTSPATAVTGSWSGGELRIVVQPEDGDLTLDVFDDVYGDHVYVTSTPNLDLSAFGCLGGPEPVRTWACAGPVQRVVVDGGEGRADITASFNQMPSFDITTGSSGGTVEITGAEATVTGGDGSDEVTAYVTGLTADLGPGDDLLRWVFEADDASVTLGAGDDRLAALPGGTNALLDNHHHGRIDLSAGRGADDVTASGRTLHARGGAGDDRFAPDATSYFWGEGEDSPVQSGDVVLGGPGVDTVVLANRSRSQPVRITLDGRANDGRRGEKDNYSVENVVVRYVAATVLGNSADNRIELFGGGTARGGPGADVLRGGTVLVGGPGRDVILADDETRLVSAADGVRDEIDCTTRRTIVHADPQDAVSASCRHVVRN